MVNKIIISPSRFAIHSSLKRVSPRRRSAGFTLVELLTVLTIISVLTAVVVPAMNGMKDADNITNASYTVAGELQRARAYAMAHNTYVWVGFYEEAANAQAPTNVFPYTGEGRLVMGLAASVDGTDIFAAGASPATIPASRLMPIDKLIKIQNVHVTDIGAPTGTGTPLESRPNGAYNGQTSEQYGINSDNVTEETPYPFALDSYTFYKTVCYTPTGEAMIDGNSALRRVGEIDLRLTHGTTVSANSSNVVAIQFTGIGGGVQTYRN